ncbi:MAG: hypothetical protein WCP20_03165 [Desulfuromonadales bacterium]
MEIVDKIRTKVQKLIVSAKHYFGMFNHKRVLDPELEAWCVTVMVKFPQPAYKLFRVGPYCIP